MIVGVVAWSFVFDLLEYRVPLFRRLLRHRQTTLVYEYPTDQGDPYYPIPTPQNAALYAKYQELADATEDVVFLGRLGTYKYYNMDQVVAQALAIYARMAGQPRREIARA